MNLSSLLAPMIHGMDISSYISKLKSLDQSYLALSEIESGISPNPITLLSISYTTLVWI